MVSGVDVGIITVAALVSLLGGTMLVSGVRSYWVQKQAVSHAEQASGTIEAVDIEPVMGGTGETYVPLVEYEYQTPTQRLHGDTLYPGGNRVSKRFHSESAAEVPIEGYEPGTETTVYYTPSTPDHSFLIPEIHRGPAVTKILFGLGICGVSVLVLFETGIL